MSGSVLGAILEGGMLSGDRDIDVGIYEVDAKKIRENLGLLESIGFKCKQRLDPLTFELKNMITLERNVPIDIKIYTKKNDKYVRNIHKSNGIFSGLLWEIIDLYSVVAVNEQSALQRRLPLISRIISALGKFTPMKIRGLIVRLMCKIWCAGKVEYGHEEVNKKYIDEKIEHVFLGVPVNIPRDYHEYLTEEYGVDYFISKEDYSNKGGWKKKSHKVTSRYCYSK
ncbi:LicD family protein [Spongiibacter sp. KMU-158]|uniref:LicD family protein n=2 Tax=Spongiibacter pelagi TaxID=2760804 RepID=A0A927C5U1_9GAMM|nr:LicD family protein [Spongiibacter pelagi]